MSRGTRRARWDFSRRRPSSPREGRERTHLQAAQELLLAYILRARPPRPPVRRSPRRAFVPLRGLPGLLVGNNHRQASVRLSPQNRPPLRGSTSSLLKLRCARWNPRGSLKAEPPPTRNLPGIFLVSGSGGSEQIAPPPTTQPTAGRLATFAYIAPS